jgi:hypothetical protein
VTSDELARRIDRLEAFEAIRQLKARYFRYVDTKQWDAFRELFTEDLEVNFAESTTGPKTREEFVASASRHFVGAMSVHHGHVPEIELVDETHATAIWPMYDLVETPPESSFESHEGWGHYTEEYRRVDGTWLISKSALTRLKRVGQG